MKRGQTPTAAVRACAAFPALVLAVLSSACAAAAVGAGAGAGGALYITSRGAESIVNASVEDVDTAIHDVYADRGISISQTKTESGGDERELSGRSGDLDVTAHFERQSPSTTKVEVTARKNLATWDKDYAKQLLEQIVKEL